MLATADFPSTPCERALDVRAPVVGLEGAIGNTPLVKLERFLDRSDLTLYAKLEYLNPGGSMKDRPAALILSNALADGRLSPNGVVVESSSGNMAIGMAQFCCLHGIRFHCITDIRTQPQNLAILRAYGAEIELIEEPDKATGDFLQARLNRVEQFVASNPDAYWPNQYSNPDNPLSHQHGTMREIDQALAGDVDVLFVATSSTGTAGGCADYLAENHRRTKIVAVDAVGSVLFGGNSADRRIPGLGAGKVPPLAHGRVFDGLERVSEIGCVVGCRRLARREGLLVGGSAGGILHTVRSLSHSFEPATVIVAIAADSGTRYLDTIYNDDWVSAELGIERADLDGLI